MKAGRLRHWLTFETLVTDLDSDGAQSQDWMPAFDASPRMPCEIVALSGRELIAAQTVHSKVTARIKVRYRPGLDAIQRARAEDGTIYNIEAVIPDPDSMRRYVTLLCSYGVNEGGTA